MMDWEELGWARMTTVEKKERNGGRKAEQIQEDGSMCGSGSWAKKESRAMPERGRKGLTLPRGFVVGEFGGLRLGCRRSPHDDTMMYEFILWSREWLGQRVGQDGEAEEEANSGWYKVKN
jgi:hypothetical protein